MENRLKCILDWLVLLVFALAIPQMAGSQENQLATVSPENQRLVSCQVPPKLIFHIRPKDLPKAENKVRLIELLKQSLADDEKGLIDLRKEKEIQALAKKLR